MDALYCQHLRATCCDAPRMSKPSPLLTFVATYALLYAGFGMQSPFVPALLRDSGFQTQEFGLVLGPIAPISDALAATAAQASRRGGERCFEYGWSRAAGSAAFALGTLVSGWQANTAGLATPISISGALLALGGVVALLLPRLPLANTPKVSTMPQ
jgi:PPP family 3-phenylpropionic acid transporter